LALYFLGMIAADLTCYHKNQDNPHYHSLGASGAVSAVVFGTIIFSPWSSIYLWGALRISALVYAVLYVIYCIYMGKRGGDNINHDAHLWGSVFGAVFTILLVALLQPQLFGPILDELSRPSLFGRG
jgi:membrane associated rhomboid family serine protease